MAQQIQVQNLDSNPGILPFKLGEVSLKTATHTFLHYIDMNEINKQVLETNKHYDDLKLLIDQFSDDINRITLLNTCNSLNYELKLVNYKIRSLMPNLRTKRGLINPLGSLVKFISGNLDQQDAEEIHNHLKELENNENKIINKFNNHLSLSKIFMRNMNKTMTVLIDNQNAIKYKVEEIRNTLNGTLFHFYHTLEINSIFGQIKNNLDILMNFLTNLETSISFSNLKIMHSSLITHEELKELLYNMSNIYNEEQLPFKNKDFLDYYKVVETNTFFYENKIIFSLNFPLIHPHPLEYYHLYSIPNVNQTIIIPPSNYLILGKHEYQYDTEECMKTSTKYFCQRSHLLPLPQSEDCVTSMLSTTKNTQTCNQISINMKNNIIEEVDQMHYIAVFPKEEKITTICEEKQVMVLKGTYLFTLPKNCEFIMSQATYTNKQGIISTHPVLISGIQTLTNINVIPIKKLNIEKVPLDKMHLIQLEEENPMENFYIHSHAVNWTLWSIFFILIIFATSYFIFRKRKLQPKPIPHPRMINETQVSPP